MRREASTDALLGILARIEHNQEVIMAQQDEINAAAAALNALVADAAAVVAQLGAFVPAEKIDTSALDAAVAAANGVGDALKTAASAVVPPAV